MKKLFFCIAIALGSVYVSAQIRTDSVIFRNAGKMYIGGANNTTTSLYVPGAVKMSSSSNGVHINITGQWSIGGNFYQDSDSAVFIPSNGTVNFFGNHSGQVREIAMSSSLNRKTSYVAFPNIKLATTDVITVAAKVGIDAKTVKRVTPNQGSLLLKSNEISSKVYDASLRITGTGAGASANYVDSGAVIVEKWVKTYRNGTHLFGFATPFDNTQKSGYFAGNWVRMPKQDANNHTRYVMADEKDQNSSNIAYDQYVSNANEELKVGRVYLIKPRPSGFDYSQLQSSGGLTVSNEADASVYDKDNFVFNGKIYTFGEYQEQLFAADNMPAYKLNTTTTATTNWLFGNSYTSAISIDALKAKLAASNYAFYSTMYVFPAGSTAWQPIQLGTGTPITVANITEIPAMSVFMLRLKNQGPNPEQFQFGKGDLVHSTVDYGQISQNAPARSNAPSNSGLNNQVIFRLTMAENENNFDLAAIGLRQNAALAGDNYDIAKVYTSDNAGFQLYTLSSEEAKLSANGVPYDVEQIAMNLKPMAYDPQTMILNVEGIETLSSEDFWIEDLQATQANEHKTHRFVNGEPYVFTTNPDDAQERFIVHFKVQPAPAKPDDETGFDGINDSKFNMYAVDKQIFIENLKAGDMGADAAIYDVAGKLIDTFKVTQYPTMTYTTNGLVSGTYVVRLFGNSNTETLKMIIR